MNWMTIWMALFGTTELLGLNMGFWAAMAVVVVIVAVMNLVFWRMRPKDTNKKQPSDCRTTGKEKSCRTSS